MAKLSITVVHYPEMDRPDKKCWKYRIAFPRSMDDIEGCFWGTKKEAMENAKALSKKVKRQYESVKKRVFNRAFKPAQVSDRIF